MTGSLDLTFLIISAFLLMGWCYYQGSLYKVEMFTDEVLGTEYVEGMVLSSPVEKEFGFLTDIRIAGKRKTGCARVLLQKEYIPGSMLYLPGKYFRKPKEAFNEGEFNNKLYLLSKNICLEGTFPRNSCHLISQKKNFHYYLGKNKRRFYKNLLEDLGRDKASVIFALLFGDKSYMQEKAKNQIFKLGLGDLFATSGLHVSIVIFFFTFLTMALGLSGLGRTLLLTVFLLIFTFLADSSASVMRSSLTCIIFLFFEQLKVKKTHITGLVLSCMIIILIYPFSLHSLSFIMSFSAILGIIFLYPKIQEEFQILPQSIALGIAASFFNLPWCTCQSKNP